MLYCLQGTAADGSYTEQLGKELLNMHTPMKKLAVPPGKHHKLLQGSLACLHRRREGVTTKSGQVVSALNGFPTLAALLQMRMPNYGESVEVHSHKVALNQRRIPGPLRNMSAFTGIPVLMAAIMIDSAT